MRYLPRFVRPLLFLVLALTTLAVPRLALAQANGGIEVLVNMFGARPDQTDLSREFNPISLAECEDNAAITFQATGINVADANDPPFISIWRSGDGTECRTGTVRDAEDDTTPDCVHVADDIEAPTDRVTFMVGAGDLFDGDCEDTERRFHFLILSGGAEDTGDAPEWDVLEIAVDADIPGPATNLTGSMGDAKIPLSWTAPSDDDVRGGFAYVDTAGCMNGTPSSTLLMAGAAPPDSGAIKVVVEGRTGGDMDASMLPYNQPVAVAVAVIDRATNQSTLSNVICVRRVPVSGGLSEYCEETGTGGGDMEACLEELECSVSAPGVPSRTGLALVGLMAAAIAFATRRARRK